MTVSSVFSTTMPYFTQLSRCLVKRWLTFLKYFIGTIYAEGRGGIPLDYDRAVLWWKRAEEARLLAELYDRQLKDPKSAAFWWHKAAESGDLEAQQFQPMARARTDRLEQQAHPDEVTVAEGVGEAEEGGRRGHPGHHIVGAAGAHPEGAHQRGHQHHQEDQIGRAHV